MQSLNLNSTGDQLEAASNMLPQLAPLKNPNTLYTATPLTLRPEKNRNLPVQRQQQQQQPQVLCSKSKKGVAT